MIRTAGGLLVILILVIFLTLFGGGCSPTETDYNEQLVLESEGILVGQIDSQSVEIEIGGQPRAFALGEGVSIAGIDDGSRVVFSYLEEEGRPLLLSIEVLERAEKILWGDGIYTGQIDSHSVEIEMAGEPRVFALGPDLSVAEVADGSRVSFTYQEGEHRPVLLSIDVLEKPSEAETVRQGEGRLVGLIDAQSVEILIERAFALGEGVVVDDIEDGALVIFSYTEDEHRAVLQSIEAVDTPVEGDVLHGNLVGQIDAQSVEIRYFRAFALGEGVTVDGLDDGVDITFTYQVGPYRPVLTSITPK